MAKLMFTVPRENGSVRLVTIADDGLGYGCSFEQHPEDRWGLIREMADAGLLWPYPTATTEEMLNHPEAKTVWSAE